MNNKIINVYTVDDQGLRGRDLPKLAKATFWLRASNDVVPQSV